MFRRGSAKELTATVVELEPLERPVKRAAADGASAPPAAKSALGITVSDISDAQKKELRVRGGAKIDAVEGAAARAGLRDGDVILSLDNTEIVDGKQFAAAAAKLDKSKAATLLVRRGDWTNYVVIRAAR